MSSRRRRLDDVALREIFKSVDAATLQTCRRVSSHWNAEIQRLDKYTSKFRPASLIMEIHGIEFRMMIGTPGHREAFVDPFTSSDFIRSALRHVDPPRILLVFLNWEANPEAVERMMDGVDSEWCRGIEELEIVSRNSDISLSAILSHLGKFPRLNSFSLSFDATNERISCSEIFRRLKHLRFLRINASEESNGVVFDDEAVEALLESQNDVRNIERIELFNTKVSVSLETMTETFRKLATLSPNPSIGTSKEDASEVHLLFHDCQWESMREHHLISLIHRISVDVTFPTLPDETEDVLLGDFRFSIAHTQFVLKFNATKTFF